MRNYEVIAEMGETDFTITTPLDDADGTFENLDGWSVVMDVKKQSGVSIVESEPCSIIDSENRIVSCTIDITEDAFENMSAGEHRIKFTATDPAGGIHKFPKSRKHQYGILKVIET